MLMAFQMICYLYPQPGTRTKTPKLATSTHISWLFCMIAFFAFFSLDKVQGQCRGLQKSSLLQLKNEFSDTIFATKLLNWNSSLDCCRWSGVTCTKTTLDLSQERVSGRLNATSPLFKLQYLTSLNLALNYFEGPIPSAFGKLVSLRYLNLSMAGFDGQIPAEISKLTRLVSLDITSLYLFGLKVEKPSLRKVVGTLSNLVELHLDYVKLETETKWSQVLSSSLPNLRVLSLKHTGLSGPIHSSFSSLASLSTIDLSDNYFNLPFPRVFSKFKELAHLSLSNCELSGTFPQNIFQLPTLKFLDLSDNYVLVTLPAAFRHSVLETLVLSRTKFAKTIPASIGGLKELATLDLSECSLVGRIPKSVSQLTRLVYVDLSQNELSGSVPSFSKAKKLKVLKLDGNEKLCGYPLKKKCKT